MTATGRRPLSQRERWDMLQAAGFRCQYCGQRAPNVTLQIDHRHPRAAGGTHDRDNLVVACTACNAGKSDRPIAEPAPIRWETIRDPDHYIPGRCLFESHPGPFHESWSEDRRRYGPLELCAYLICETCNHRVAYRVVEVRAA